MLRFGITTLLFQKEMPNILIKLTKSLSVKYFHETMVQLNAHLDLVV
jgi:hypothetical protein